MLYGVKIIKINARSKVDNLVRCASALALSMLAPLLGFLLELLAKLVRADGADI